jgi:hypothetical protein
MMDTDTKRKLGEHLLKVLREQGIATKQAPAADTQDAATASKEDK